GQTPALRVRVQGVPDALRRGARDRGGERTLPLPLLRGGGAARLHRAQAALQGRPARLAPGLARSRRLRPRPRPRQGLPWPLARGGVTGGRGDGNWRAARARRFGRSATIVASRERLAHRSPPRAALPRQGSRRGARRANSTGGWDGWSGAD